MNLRRPSLKFLRTAKLRQLNRQPPIFRCYGKRARKLVSCAGTTYRKGVGFRCVSLTWRRPNLVWRFVISAVAPAANYGEKTKI
jgi:hypothetical protein